jgi:hypothetical protein
MNDVVQTNKHDNFASLLGRNEDFHCNLVSVLTKFKLIN